jgi:hypothetical protein
MHQISAYPLHHCTNLGRTRIVRQCTRSVLVQIGNAPYWCAWAAPYWCAPVSTHFQVSKHSLRLIVSKHSLRLIVSEYSLRLGGSKHSLTMQQSEYSLRGGFAKNRLPLFEPSQLGGGRGEPNPQVCAIFRHSKKSTFILFFFAPIQFVPLL